MTEKNKTDLTREERRVAFEEINQKSDRIMTSVLIAYFIFGLLLGLF